jgi:hypothetical protein
MNQELALKKVIELTRIENRELEKNREFEGRRERERTRRETKRDRESRASITPFSPY